MLDEKHLATTEEIERESESGRNAFCGEVIQSEVAYGDEYNACIDNETRNANSRKCGKFGPSMLQPTMLEDEFD